MSGVSWPRNMDARRAWQERQTPLPPAVPVPVHTSRDPYPAGVPASKGVAGLKTLAEGAGWYVALTYSRGPWLGLGGDVLCEAHTLAVRGADVGRWFHALYVRPLAGQKWVCETVLILPGSPVGLFPYAGVNDLKEWVLARGAVPAGWYTAITGRLAAQTARQRETTRARPRVARAHA